MISGLEGYKFLGPKGQNAVRPQDHALLQPMFQVKLTKNGSRLVATTIDTATPYETAPPIKIISR
jgi:branched-chain amino acid transport system substrate-binding protein